MKKFNAKKHISNFDWGHKELEAISTFPDTYGENMIFTNSEGKKVRSYVNRDKEGYRVLNLDVTSLLGSVGAVHYYGKLIDHSLCFTRAEDKENKSSMGGYFLKGIPDEYSSFEFQLVRPVTQKDIQHDIDYGREDYMISEIGDTTRGFWKEEQVIALGKKVFLELFKGKWKLNINSYSGDKDEEVIAPQH